MADNAEEEVNTEEADELIVPAESEEKETPAPSSGEEQPTEETEEEPATPDEEAVEPEETPEVEAETEEPVEETKPEPVVGETPRERALRLEVQRVKEINRGLRGKKLLGDVQPLAASQSTELSDEDKKALEVFDPEQVSNMEKLFPILAKKQGFVRKDDFSKDQYQSASQDALDTWLEGHPDYLPENDKGDVLFNHLKAEMALYQRPANPRGWVKILNRAHNEIMGIKTQVKVSAEQVAAQQEKIKIASHGPASGGPKKGEQLRVTATAPDIKQAIASGALKGFTEEDFS